MFIKNIEIKGKAILGPMAGVCDAAFRVICSELGAGMVYTEMVSIEGLKHKNLRTASMTYVDKNESITSLQIFGESKESFAEAAKHVSEYSDCQIIDINMGCPAPKVAIKSKSGSSLMKDVNKIGEIVKATVENSTKPVTVKMRLGWDSKTLTILEAAKIAQDNGAAAIAIHGRTREEMYRGNADWSWIKKAKDLLIIPVIGNGDIVDEKTAKDMFDQTGCDAVMISRGAQGNPWIFKQIDYFMETGKIMEKPTFEEWSRVVKRHYELVVKFKGENLANKEMRKQFVWYIGTLPKREICKFMKEEASKINGIKDIIRIIDMYNLNEQEVKYVTEKI
ncbi:tRNA dihydrouridine synthase DusB [Spiroplasma endosymbiont of Othius punctulatus]|uniref:tRNA dihydrouridine synthase DusB n=1 Tax=Spiroplasma endosymbiont of Othius punctulatus TaxID=3066289 RepID=UPI0030D47879